MFQVTPAILMAWKPPPSSFVLSRHSFHPRLTKLRMLRKIGTPTFLVVSSFNMWLFPSYRGCSVTAIFTLKPVWGAEDFLDSVGSACLSLWAPRKNKPGNGKPRDDMFSKGRSWQRNRGQSHSVARLIQSKAPQMENMETAQSMAAWFHRGSEDMWWWKPSHGDVQHATGDITSTKLGIFTWILRCHIFVLMAIGNPEANSFRPWFCWIWLAIFPIGNPLLAESIGICVFLYLLGFLTQIQVVVSRVCHAPGLVMPNDCYFSTGVKAPIRWLNHALGEK